MAATAAGMIDGAVPVRVDEVARAHQHAGDAHLLAEVGEMHVRVARRDGAGQHLEARRPLRDVADAAVGDDADAAEALCTALCTSPQKAPKPTSAPSRSWMTMMAGRGLPLAMYS